MKHVLTLIEKSAKAHDSGDAMRFSQAACNAANSLIVLENLKNVSHKEMANAR